MTKGKTMDKESLPTASTLVIGPTGCGKSYWFACLEKAFRGLEGRTVGLPGVLAHLPTPLQALCNLKPLKYEFNFSDSLRRKITLLNSAMLGKDQDYTIGIEGTRDAITDEQLSITKFVKNRVWFFPLLTRTQATEYNFDFYDSKGGAAFENIDDKILDKLLEVDRLVICFAPKAKNGDFDEDEFEENFVRKFHSLMQRVAERCNDNKTNSRIARIIFTATKTDAYLQSLAEQRALGEGDDRDARKAHIDRFHLGFLRYLNRPRRKADPGSGYAYSLARILEKHVIPEFDTFRELDFPVFSTPLFVGFAFISAYGFYQTGGSWRPNVSSDPDKQGQYANRKRINPLNVLAPFHFCTAGRARTEYGIEIIRRYH